MTITFEAKNCHDMIKFILNNETVSTDLPSGTTVLDFVRYHQNLTGTKIGCREGDCGACTLLVGENGEEGLNYKSLTSCITPIGNVHGKHVVTIEGLNMNKLSPVQKSLVDESGTHCGFCTVGFVMSLTGCCMSKKDLTYDEMISAIDGNICRCTGYKSIERAAESLLKQLHGSNTNDKIVWLTKHDFIPDYFDGIADKLLTLDLKELNRGTLIVGGGTDLYVQKHHETEESEIHFAFSNDAWKGIEIHGNKCVIGGASTVSDLLRFDALNEYFPRLNEHLKLVSSTPIRNIGTIAGNFVNASPIGDLTAFFLALNSEITLTNPQEDERKILLRDFYKGYKSLDKRIDEVISQIAFELPDKNSFFNFEKVSKRTYLDIASVNTAMLVRVKNNAIETVHISAGGVGPTPLYLKRAAEFLVGKTLSPELIEPLQQIIQSEISPISDVRGSADYKRLLLNNLVLAHFVELFPTIFNEQTVA